MSDKPCRKCNITRNEAELQNIQFVKNKNICLLCNRIQIAVIRENKRKTNPEYKKEFDRQYRLKNVDKLREKDRIQKNANVV